MKLNQDLNWLTHVLQNVAAIKPKPQPKATRREGDHCYWFIKMFIRETKQEPTKKSSNSTIINQKHPDKHNRQTNGQNTQHQ